MTTLQTRIERLEAAGETRAQKLDRQHAATVEAWINTLADDQVERIVFAGEGITAVTGRAILAQVVTALEWWAERHPPPPNGPETLSPDLAELAEEERSLDQRIKATCRKLGARTSMPVLLEVMTWVEKYRDRY